VIVGLNDKRFPGAIPGSLNDVLTCECYPIRRGAVSKFKGGIVSKYVIVRTYSAGVFAGFLQSRSGKEVVLINARRLWYWKGAASLSQLATTGTSQPNGCKFPVPVSRVELLEAIEILDVTDAARQSIESVPVWSE